MDGTQGAMGLINKSVPKCVKSHSTRTAKIANVCMLSQFSHVQLFVTPWAIACQAPLFMKFSISRQEYWSGLPFPTQGDLPGPGIEAVSLTSLELGRQVLHH